MNPTSRNDWIDTWRASSALAVALFHFNRVFLPGPADWLGGSWQAIWLKGYWGIAVFFVLSGYCLFPGWSRSTGCRDFLQRRAGRIFPPYWGSLLLIAGLALGAKLLTGVNDVAALPRNAVTIGATLLLLTHPVTTIPTINWVYWTLSCVIAFYAATGLVLVWPRHTRLRALVALHLLLCAAAVARPPGPVGPLFFVGYWPIFGLGLALAVWQNHRSAGRVMLLASLLHATWLLVRRTEDPDLLAVGAATTGLLALCRNLTFPGWLRPVPGLGRISYSLYLVHVPVGIYALGRFLPGTFHSAFSFIGSQLLLLAATVAAAALFYFITERPFLPPPRPAALA